MPDLPKALIKSNFDREGMPPTASCEAWFAELSEVPKQAIAMSVRQILKSNEILGW